MKSFLALSIVTSLFASCVDTSESYISKTKQLKLYIISPYGCYNEINLNTSGQGTSIFGLGNPPNDTAIIKSKKEFSIESGKDTSTINKVINDIETRKFVTSPRMIGGYRFILSLNDTKFIDKYGQDTLVDNFLKVLVPYIQNDTTGECDYINLFKRSIK